MNSSDLIAQKQIDNVLESVAKRLAKRGRSVICRNGKIEEVQDKNTKVYLDNIQELVGLLAMYYSKRNVKHGGHLDRDAFDLF